MDAANRLGREWAGIDITYIAVDLIEKRLRHTYGDSIALAAKIQTLPESLRLSLTWDQGPEMRDWKQVSVDATLIDSP